MPLSAKLAVIDAFPFLLSVGVPASQENKCPVGCGEVIAISFERPVDHEDLEVFLIPKRSFR